MVERFEIEFLEEAADFLDKLDEKSRGKVPQSEIDKAERIRKQYFELKRQRK